MARSDDVAEPFEAIARSPATLNVDKTWKVATDLERRVLIDEFIEEITVLSDYLDVKVHGAPSVHVLYQEVGLKESGFDRVGGAYDPASTPALFKGKVQLQVAAKSQGNAKTDYNWPSSLARVGAEPEDHLHTKGEPDWAGGSATLNEALQSAFSPPANVAPTE